MSERENGWYLRSDGYITSECSYQRITAMKGNRALDNHEKLVFVKYMGGEETDSRVYVPHPGTCEMVTGGTLTAEQVRKAIFDCSTYASYDGCTWNVKLADMNAELGSERTCRREKHGTKMDGSPKLRCSLCGYGIGDKRWSYCPSCGGKVKR